MAPISVYATYCAHFVFPSFLHYNGMHIQLSKIHVLPRFQNKMLQDRILEKILDFTFSIFWKERLKHSDISKLSVSSLLVAQLKGKN